MHEDWRDDCFRLSEDPQNYCDPQERTLGGTFAKGEKGVKAAQVQVCYLLVVPKATPKSVSEGWSENRTRNDHIGEVYCLLLLGGPSTIIKTASSFEHFASRYKICLKIHCDYELEMRAFYGS